MRTPTGARIFRVACGSFLCLGLFSATGCATLRATFAGYATARGGITRSQQTLRDAMVDQDFVKALGWHDDDALLQSLTTGAAAYYAGQYARSAAMLDTAALLADDRITASLSKDGLALVTNDMARPYQPRRTERLFIPYYAMLSYVRLGAWEDAAVEARRLVALLEQFGEDRDEAERSVHGSLEHLAGAVLERAGERDPARVAYRAAHELRNTLPETIPPASIADQGELLLVVERGFVAHRATGTIELELDDEDEHDTTRYDSLGRRRPLPLSQYGALSLASSHHRRHHDDDDYHVTIAFPTLRRSPRPWGGDVRVAVDGLPVDGLSASTVVDDASAVDERRERAALAVRAAARAAAKYAVTKAIKDKKGEVAGELANFGASLLERADVRSWHLLPQEIALIRVRVPAGTRDVRLQVGEGWAVRAVELGSVVVRRGELSIVPVRLWRDPAPSSTLVSPAPVIADAESCVTFFCP
ncbi:MAG TPA: hypothetical protein VFI52_05785 [Gemmatimonadaceae bacterium]|nr:hypothetical protein [Gemmatimonadaceae bacterium]